MTCYYKGKIRNRYHAALCRLFAGDEENALPEKDELFVNGFEVTSSCIGSNCMELLRLHMREQRE